MAISQISVLVTFYNQEKYVDKAISSIVEQQNFDDIQILVGDDCSSDSTTDSVKKWMSLYPQKIKLYVMNRDENNITPGFRASRNRLNLLKHVRTKYFIFLDGDDYFCSKEKLSKQIDILEKPDNSDCIACGHNTIILSKNNTLYTTPKIPEGKYCPKEYWEKYYFHTDSLLIRSSVISKINFELLENNFNDNLITFSVIQQGSIYYIPENWCVYLQTGNGIWTSGKYIENNIRNMFLFDLCNKINPKMKKETIKRFSSTWINLLKIRNRINSDKLSQFDIEAKDIKLSNSYKWIHYNDHSIISKIYLYIVTLFNLRMVLFENIKQIYFSNNN